MYNRINTIILVSVFLIVGLFTGCLKQDRNAYVRDHQLFLVGTGTGDTDLLSLRAIAVMKGVDVIVCFKRSAKKYAEFIKGKELIVAPHGFWHFYGKRESQCDKKPGSRCTVIIAKRNKFIKRVNTLLRAGKKIAVLSSGDAMIYGPWSWVLEEFNTVKQAVVPGISCFNAANAALKKSPTRATKTKSVILSAKDFQGRLDTIEKLAVHGTTMALFTMRSDFDVLVRKLKKVYPFSTPVAVVIRAGYKKDERVIQATLGTLDKKVKKEELPFEYMIYVGDFLSYTQK